MKTRLAIWDANCSVRFSTQDSGGLKMFFYHSSHEVFWCFTLKIFETRPKIGCFQNNSSLKLRPFKDQSKNCKTRQSKEEYQIASNTLGKAIGGAI